MYASPEIDYWDIVKRSISIAWNHKFLWFFGFFAASGGGGNFLNIGDNGGERIRDFFLANIELVVVIVLGIVFLWLIFFVMNLISKGALIGCIDRARRGEGIGFDIGWHAGFKAFWGMLGLFVTGFVAFLIVSVVCVLAVVLPLAAGAPGIALAVVIGAVLFIPYLVFLFLLTFTITYAEREYVIRGEGVTEALGTGWRMTRQFLGKSFLMWLISLLSVLVFIVSVLIVLVAASLPFILIALASPIVALVLGIPLAIVVLAVTGAAYSTYDHALWTLAYGALRPSLDVPQRPGPAFAGRPTGGVS
jgi:hypothetical protein